jgi:hypothetical protein
MITNEVLKKRSRQGAVLSGVGFLIMMAAFTCSLVELHRLNTRQQGRIKIIDCRDSQQTRISFSSDARSNSDK